MAATVDEQVAAIQASLDQAQAQNAALTQQLREAQGFRQEALNARESIASLTAAAEQSGKALDAANRAASAAQAQIDALTAQAAENAKLVDAARGLAAALKTLTG